MKDILLTYIEKLIPNQLPIFMKRYEVLRTIYIFQPVGRRYLSEYLHYSERTVRGDIEVLQKSGLVEITKAGVFVTRQGIMVLNGLESMVKHMSGFSVLERELENILGVKRVNIVQGDSDKNPDVKREIGRAAARALFTSVKKDSTIAVTGGSTVAEIVDGFAETTSKKALRVLPARGSIGRNVELQSDTLAARLAKKLSAQYRILSVPDNLSSKTMNEVKNEPTIQKTLSLLKETDILVFGIGEAMEMAVKRKVSNAVYEILTRKRAVAEALGYYFNNAGEIVYETEFIGIHFQDIAVIPHVIAAAGGFSKAASILAVSRALQKNATIVMDEAAAKEIIHLSKL